MGMARAAILILVLLLAMSAGDECDDNNDVKNADFEKGTDNWAAASTIVQTVSGSVCYEGSKCVQQKATGVYEDLFHQDVVVPATIEGYQAIARLWVNGITQKPADKDCANDDARIILFAYDGGGSTLGKHTGQWASLSGKDQVFVKETWDLPENTQRLRYQVETGDCVNTGSGRHATGLTFDHVCMFEGVPWCSATTTQWAASATASSYKANHAASTAKDEPLEWDSNPTDPSNCDPKADMEWRPSTRKDHDWLELSYTTPMYLDRIVIVLDYEPGRISNITVHPIDSTDPKWYADSANKVWDAAWGDDEYERFSNKDHADYCIDNTKKRPYWSPTISRTESKIDKVRIDVKAVSDEAEEAWSSIDAVMIDGCVNANPHAPTNLRPEIIHDTSPTIEWDKGFDYDGDALTYHVFVGSALYGSDVVNDEETTGTSWDITSTLTYDTDYFVRLFSEDPHGGVSTVTDAIFKCANDAPGMPYDIAPNVTTELNPTLTWKCENVDNDTLRYSLNVGSELFRWGEVPGDDELDLRRYLVTFRGVEWIQRRVLFGWGGLDDINSDDQWGLREYLRYWHEQGDWVGVGSIVVNGNVVTLTHAGNKAILTRSGDDILMDISLGATTIINDWKLEVNDDEKVLDIVTFVKNGDDTKLTVSNSSGTGITFTRAGADVSMVIPGKDSIGLKAKGDDPVIVYDRNNIVEIGRTTERSFEIETTLAYGDYHVELWAEDVFPEGDPNEGKVMPNGQSYLAFHTFTVGEMPQVLITSHKNGEVIDGQAAMEVWGESNFPLSEVKISVLDEFGNVVQASNNCKVNTNATGHFNLTKDKGCKPLYNKGTDTDRCEDSRKAWSVRASIVSGVKHANHTVLVRMKGKSKLEYHPSVLECVSIDATPCSVDFRIKNLGGLTSLTIKTGASLRHWAQLYPVPPPTLDVLQEVTFNIILNPPGLQSTHSSKLEIYVRDQNDDRCTIGGKVKALEIPVIIRRIQLLEILDYYVRLPALGRDVELVKRFAIMEVNEDEEELVSVEITVW